MRRQQRDQGVRKRLPSPTLVSVVANDGVRLSRSRLSVRKEGTVVALEGIRQQTSSQVVVHDFLTGNRGHEVQGKDSDYTGFTMLACSFTQRVTSKRQEWKR